MYIKGFNSLSLDLYKTNVNLTSLIVHSNLS